MRFCWLLLFIFVAFLHFDFLLFGDKNRAWTWAYLPNGNKIKSAMRLLLLWMTDWVTEWLNGWMTKWLTVASLSELYWPKALVAPTNLYSSFGQQQQSLRRLLTNNFSDKIINQNFISRSSSDFYLLPSLSIAYLNFYGFCAFFMIFLLCIN